jgi:hypothetical protein
MDQENGNGFLRKAEMLELLRSEKDEITSQLMWEASNSVFKRVLKGGDGPVSDFDLNFFMEVMQEFCGQHKVLKTILDGEGKSLEWFPDL